MTKKTEICFVASSDEKAQKALESFKEQYSHTSMEKADVIVALGGDGLMLETLHKNISRKTPIYGMNNGTVGFLMNKYNSENLIERIKASVTVNLHPLRMNAITANGKEIEALAINEVSLLRQSRQTANIRISIDGKVRLEKLVSDGAMVATPAGSTAYNLSVHGPILPIDSNVLALTPISAFRPRRWNGAILPHTANVTFEILDNIKRPVSAVADFTEARNVVNVSIKEDRSISMPLLFDKDHALEERVLAEQFL